MITVPINFDAPMPDAVTVAVSTDLLEILEDDWSPPVQIHITRTPGIGSGYEMTARTLYPPTRDQLAAILDPDAFDPDKPRSKQQVAILQWAARRHMAYEGADRLLAADVLKGGDKQ